MITQTQTLNPNA